MESVRVDDMIRVDSMMELIDGLCMESMIRLINDE